jgi:hypothetical protein
MKDAAMLLDTAKAAAEVATLAALVLINEDGDAQRALAILEKVAPLAAPLEDRELDAARIAQQAIRDALAMRGELG